MILSDMRTQVARRCDEDQNQSNRWYTDAVLNAAINDGLTVYASLTLCVESTFSFNTTQGLPWYDLQQIQPGFLVPLRVWTADGQLQKRSLVGFASKQNAWRNWNNPAESYCLIGANLMGLYPPPDGVNTINCTAAVLPTTLSFDAASPNIPTDDHQALVEFAIWFVRIAREGFWEQKAIARFFDIVSRRITLVRERAKAERFLFMPPELSKDKMKQLLEDKRERINRN